MGGHVDRIPHSGEQEQRIQSHGRWMKMTGFDFVLSIGGAAGQGIATPGNILARMFARRGVHMYAYNAFQSIIRGGHILLTIRIADVELPCHGDKMDLLMCLNQDTLDRHLRVVGLGRAPSTTAVTSGPVTPPKASRWYPSRWPS